MKLADFDKNIRHKHGPLLAGVDEAGCGPWAGPVVAAAVILNPDHLDPYLYCHLNDSKKNTPGNRQILFDILVNSLSIYHAIGIASVTEIDQLNIRQAAILAMQRALSALSVCPSYTIIDGNAFPSIAGKIQTVIKGDSQSLSIAAASIIAKVHRDQLMNHYHTEYPGYGWDTNKGYGTLTHQEGLKKWGITIHHRRSFKPIAAYLLQS